MKNLFWIALLGMIFTACTSDAEEKANEAKNQLLGKWELQSAERAGKKTSSLRGLYFEFSENGVIETNLSGAIEEGNYVMNEDIIEQRNTKMDTDYKVETLGDSTLVLSTNLRDTDFKFMFARALVTD